jgi:hypothetical protein
MRTMPGLQINTLIIMLERLLDYFEQRVGLCVVNAHIVPNGQDNLAQLFLFAVLVLFLVFVEADGDVDAGFGGPGGVNGEPVCGWSS